MSGYIGTQPVPKATGTLKEGTFSSDSDTINVSYSPGYIHLYIDGMLVPESQFTAVDGSSIVLDSEYPSGTQYIVEEFRTFELPDFPSQIELNEQGFARQVDSVSDLQNGSFDPSLQRIWLSGYYGVGTPGGGPLYRDSDDTTTADNGETVFVDADGKRWKRPVAYGSNEYRSLSDMQADAASDIPSDFVVYLHGRTTVGDGGEGHFHWDPSDLSTEVGNDEVTTDEGDGGIYVAPVSDKTGASGAWVRQFTGAVNAAWYGFHESKADIGPAWQSAIDATVSLGFHELQLPPGSFDQGTKVSKNLGGQTGRLLIRGAGAHGTVITSSIESDRSLELLDASLTTVENIYYIGNGNTGGTGNGHAISLEDSAIGSGTVFPQNSDVRDCRIEKFRGDDVDADGKAIVAAGIYFGGGLALYPDRNVVDECGHGIFLYKTQNTHATRNVVSIIDKWGIRFEQTVDDCSASENDVINCGDHLGVFSETIVGRSVPYGSFLISSTQGYGVNILNNKMKNSIAAVSAILCSRLLVRHNWIRPRDTGDDGQSSIWTRLCEVVAVNENTFSMIAVGAANYQCIENKADASNVIPTFSAQNNFFDHADTVTFDILYDGDGANAATASFVGNSFGRRSREGQPDVTDCIVLQNGIFYGQITGNRALASDDGSSGGGTITDTVDLSNNTDTNQLSIWGNADFEQSDGTITNKFIDLLDTYTVATTATDRNLDASADSTENVANVLGVLIRDLRDQGFINI